MRSSHCETDLEVFRTSKVSWQYSESAEAPDRRYGADMGLDRRIFAIEIAAVDPATDYRPPRPFTFQQKAVQHPNRISRTC